MATLVASLTRIGAACAVMIVCAALPASAQTAEQLFDASQLQEVRLFINARDQIGRAHV